MIRFNADRINLAIDRLTDQKRRSEIFAAAAVKVRDDALATNTRILGRRPAYDTFVDGTPSSNLAAVKPGGRVVFRFDVGFFAAETAVRVLREISPYDPTPDGFPHYRDRHFVIADEAIHPPPYSNLGPFNRLLIMNDRIYTRKLEVKYNVYERAHAVVHRQLRGAYRVTFVFDDYFGERFPAILIRPKAA